MTEAPGVAAAAAFERRAWAEVHRLLSAVSPDECDVADLERLAVASYLIGRDREALAAWGSAHRRHLALGDRAEAARCGFWVAFCSMLQGQMSHARGWLTRSRSVLGDDADCAAAGYLLVPELLGALDSGDAARGAEMAVTAGEIAARFGDRDLAALAMLGHGQALLAMGDESSGMAHLDEAMVSLSAGEVGPIVSGVVYCAVIVECMQAFDLARAAEWTGWLDEWCRSQPDLVAYRGQCLVHQSQLQQAGGDWARAASTAGAACARLADPPHPALGSACYQAGELHRLRGDLVAAADEYRRASRAGYQPMPGVALLELARGDAPGAVAGIRRALGDAAPPFQRPELLMAAVTIYLAARHADEAKAAADELRVMADRSVSEVLVAMAAEAAGAVLLDAGAGAESAAAALVHLRAASAAWRGLRMPYEAARVSALLARGCLAVGDRASAALELDSARATFRELGAEPDLARLRPLLGSTAGRDVLSAREVEVLGHVAAGLTNRQIAAGLSISEHTVGRHLENIFAKLGVSGRAAATAYAYEHDLL